MSEAEQWTVNCEMWNASFDSFSLLFSNELEGFFWNGIELLTIYQHIRRKSMGKKEEKGDKGEDSNFPPNVSKGMYFPFFFIQ